MTKHRKPDEQRNARELRIARFLMVSHLAAKGHLSFIEKRKASRSISEDTDHCFPDFVVQANLIKQSYYPPGMIGSLNSRWQAMYRRLLQVADVEPFDRNHWKGQMVIPFAIPSRRVPINALVPESRLPSVS
jgi:hypothetical protein